ncbi:50S ribosomal protein L15 [Agromyces mariniharenae]|uniref:Large ribosomal subunit protein uL15 n=1 Tax=Agromyces mariniharenae TaxID=2604423 RepID=A0A5S4V897_9MICO|nr:50S ribosomal protein L15 [Agromyces mariniharenae]TYL54288.1 50S ribosomal protein L15 [Agromyces mariniharenae]
MAEEKNEAVAEETPKKAPARKAAAKPAAEKAAAKPAAEKAPAKKAPAKAAAAKADDAKADKAPAKKAPAKKAEQDVAKREPVLKVHHLRPAPGAKKDKTRVGRGEGSKGKTAGRGTKGSKARNNIRPGFEGGQLPYHMRAPKLRGFKNPFRVEYQVVNLDKLAELYPKGGDVTVADLVDKGAVRKNERVKVLGNGDIQVKLNVEVDKVSGSAEQKIVAAGGSVK